MTAKIRKAYRRKRVSFRFEAGDAREVFLSGDFNGWDKSKHPMSRGKDGVWVKTLMLEPGRYCYKFIVDGEWRRDPLNPDVVENPFGTLNSVIVVA